MTRIALLALLIALLPVLASAQEPPREPFYRGVYSGCMNTWVFLARATGEIVTGPDYAGLMHICRTMAANQSAEGAHLSLLPGWPGLANLPTPTLTPTPTRTPIPYYPKFDYAPGAS